MVDKVDFLVYTPSSHHHTIHVIINIKRLFKCLTKEDCFKLINIYKTAAIWSLVLMFAYKQITCASQESCLSPKVWLLCSQAVIASL